MARKADGQKPDEWTLTTLCLHTAIQLLDVLATRQTSFIDHSKRPKGVEGRRYLRWAHLSIRLVGYDNDQPVFVIVGAASGTKFQASAGDKFFTDFTISSRKPYDNVSSGTRSGTWICNVGRRSGCYRIFIIRCNQVQIRW
jgi:hypothetical protein